MLASQLSLPEKPGARNHRRCGLVTGVRIVDDSVGVERVPAAPGDCKAALFEAASYGKASNLNQRSGFWNDDKDVSRYRTAHVSTLSSQRKSVRSAIGVLGRGFSVQGRVRMVTLWPA